MNKLPINLSGLLLLLIAALVFSCKDQKTLSIEVSNQSTTFEQNQGSLKTPKNGFSSGLLASDGTLWFGSNGGGVYRYDGSSFTNFSEADGFCDNQVMSIIQDKENTLWFGTSNGLCKYNNKTFTHVPIPFSDTTSVWLDKVYPIINPNAVHALLQDSNDTIWIGTCGAGAYRYDGKKFTSYLSDVGQTLEDDLHHNWISSIAEDKEGNIWFSSMTRGGTSRYDGTNFTQFMPKDGLFTDMVRTIFTDKAGTIWLGYKATHDGGFTRYDGTSFTNFYKADGLPIHSVRVIYEDKNGLLWLGGDLNNLSTYDGKNFKVFTSKEGKTYDGIFTILEDADGNVWFGGKNGLWKFDGETVTAMTK